VIFICLQNIINMPSKLKNGIFGEMFPT
jgi:hypothetical protein